MQTRTEIGVSMLILLKYMDLRGSIPSFIKITYGKGHDINILDELIQEPGSFYVMDRGYLDFARLYALNLYLAFFVVRSKMSTILLCWKPENLTFLTNNLTLPALTIALLYKSRWQIELFFQWIKQHLRIKAFYGTSENLVKTQIWIAISVYILVAIIKKRLNLDQSLYAILQILSITLFEKVTILHVLINSDYENQTGVSYIQLPLFNL